jgi:hypothetical protein
VRALSTHMQRTDVVGGHTQDRLAKLERQGGDSTAAVASLEGLLRDMGDRQQVRTLQHALDVPHSWSCPGQRLRGLAIGRHPPLRSSLTPSTLVPLQDLEGILSAISKRLDELGQQAQQRQQTPQPPTPSLSSIRRTPSPSPSMAPQPVPEPATVSNSKVSHS